MSYEVVGSEPAYDGKVFSVRVDSVRMPDGSVKPRDVVRHPGAVGVVALDDDGRILLIRQYRHPVGSSLLELPAGILGVDTEPGRLAAARELAEEAGLRADRWDVLVDAWTSPGMSDEAVRVYLARGITDAPDSDFERVDEETDLQPRWVRLDEAVAMALAGTLTNSLCLLGVLATAAARGEEFRGLRAAGAPWPARPDRAG